MAMVVPFLIGARLSSSGGVGEGHRRGDAGGTSDVVTLEGEPARAVDGSGNRLAGAVLTFRQGRSRVDVESAPGVKTEGVFRPEGS